MGSCEDSLSCRTETWDSCSGRPAQGCFFSIDDLERAECTQGICAKTEGWVHDHFG